MNPFLQWVSGPYGGIYNVSVLELHLHWKPLTDMELYSKI